MSEQNTIPAEMLDAATKAIWNSAMENPNFDGLPDEDCQTFAEVALEAAGVPALVARIAELEAALANLERLIETGAAHVNEDDLAVKDARIAELEAELGEVNLIAEARSVVGMDLLAEADQQEARIAELEAALDLARMQAADNTALTEKAAKYAASKDSRIAELEAANVKLRAEIEVLETENAALEDELSEYPE